MRVRHLPKSDAGPGSDLGRFGIDRAELVEASEAEDDFAVEGNAAADQTGVPPLGNDGYPGLTAQGKDGGDLGGVAGAHHRWGMPLEAAGPVNGETGSRLAGQNMRRAHHCGDGPHHRVRQYGFHRFTRHPGDDTPLLVFALLLVLMTYLHARNLRRARTEAIHRYEVRTNLSQT